MEMKFCQSCGMPLTSDEVCGTNADGSLSADYCTYCYQQGKFAHDLKQIKLFPQSRNLKRIEKTQCVHRLHMSLQLRNKRFHAVQLPFPYFQKHIPPRKLSFQLLKVFRILISGNRVNRDCFHTCTACVPFRPFQTL